VTTKTRAADVVHASSSHPQQGQTHQTHTLLTSSNPQQQRKQNTMAPLHPPGKSSVLVVRHFNDSISAYTRVSPNWKEHLFMSTFSRHEHVLLATTYPTGRTFAPWTTVAVARTGTRTCTRHHCEGCIRLFFGFLWLTVGFERSLLFRNRGREYIPGAFHFSYLYPRPRDFCADDLQLLSVDSLARGWVGLGGGDLPPESLSVAQ
jgi:hypothetical protein